MQTSIQKDLKSLQLHYLAENWEDLIQTNAKLNPERFMTKLVELELMEKSRRSMERRLKSSKLGNFKKMNEFDWSWPQEIEENKIKELMATDFVAEKKNVIFAGSAGMGKTMIAKNLAWNSVIKGHSVLYTTASKLVIDLGSQESSIALKRAFAKYAKPDLLVIDEIGYISFDTKAADFLFEIINQRYEQGSIIMTTNLAFKDWQKIFPGAPCLTAMVDRLTHHAVIVKVIGDSYRRKSKEKK